MLGYVLFSQTRMRRYLRASVTLLNLIAKTPQQYIQSTCATSGDGLYEGLEWLATTLRKAGHQ